MKIADLNLVEALAELQNLIESGLSEDQALTHFKWLHPIQKARLQELWTLTKKAPDQN